MKYRVLKDFVNKKGILHKAGEIMEWGAEGNFLRGLLDGGFIEKVSVPTEAVKAVSDTIAAVGKAAVQALGAVMMTINEDPTIIKYQYHLAMSYEEFVHKTRRLDGNDNQYKYEIPEEYDCVKSRLLYIELLETKGFTL